jgi:hypothetical protein
MQERVLEFRRRMLPENHPEIGRGMCGAMRCMRVVDGDEETVVCSLHSSIGRSNCFNIETGFLITFKFTSINIYIYMCVHRPQRLCGYTCLDVYTHTHGHMLKRKGIQISTNNTDSLFFPKFKLLEWPTTWHHSRRRRRRRCCCSRRRLPSERAAANGQWGAEGGIRRNCLQQWHCHRGDNFKDDNNL